MQSRPTLFLGRLLMRILLIGATGTIGKAVASVLSSGHELVRVSRSKGEYRVDPSNLHNGFTLPTVARLVLPIPVLRYRF